MYHISKTYQQNTGQLHKNLYLIKRASKLKQYNMLIGVHIEIKDKNFGEL